MKNTHKLLAGLSALLLLASPSLRASTILVNDMFVDGGFTDGADPLDLAWTIYPFTGAPPTASIASDELTGPDEGPADNALNLAVGAQGFRGVAGILAVPVTLAIGDQLILSYDHKFSGSGNQAAAIRFGLYNQNGTSIANNDFGYFGRMATGTGSPAVEAWKEIGLETVLGGGDTSVIPGGSGSGYVGATTTSVNMGMILTRLGASSMLVELTQNGSTVWTATDATSSYFTYDVIALGTGTNNSDYRLDNINLTFIPEPGTFALVGLSLLALLALRRR